MKGKLCVITGANSGIGKEMAKELAGRGARVVMVCRNAEKGEAALQELRAQTGSQELELAIGDVSSLASVRALAGWIAERHDRVDVLLNNAGVYLPRRSLSVDGHEMMFATNHLGPFLLTHLLRPLLQAAAPSRVITVSSYGHHFGRLHLDDLDCERGFISIVQYGTTKLQNILFTRELSRRSRELGISANCFHPGSVASGFAQDEAGAFQVVVRAVRPFLISAERGARTGVYLASAEEAGAFHGEYFFRERAKRPSRAARDDEAARGLWEASERLVGIA